jgi:hypothetical protein
MNNNPNGGDGGGDDPVMDWALGERLGGERPPDLVDGVRARLEAGGFVRDVASPVPRLRGWLLAAALLGVTVVLALATMRREPGLGVAGAQEAVEPNPEPVWSLADVAKLPAKTRAVEMFDVGDATVAALTRLRDLEILIVREPFHENSGLGLKSMPPVDPRRVTAEVWQHLLSFTKLRRLELSGTLLAGRVAPEQIAEGLERLPLLSSLTLRFLDTDTALLAVLPRIRSLQCLDLSFNHGFVDGWLEPVLQCRSLRTLSLRGCQQVRSVDLARLHELPELEQLDVGSIDGMSWRNAGVFLDDAERDVIARAQRVANRIGMGPTDDALEGLGMCPKLKVLDISGGHWSSAGLGGLGACRTLRVLKATGGQEPAAGWVAAMPRELERLDVCGDYRDDFCAAVAAHLTSLRHLNLAACYQITDRGLAAVAAMPSLRVLDMRQMRGLTVASIDTLLGAQQLEELDVRHCDFVTAEHVVRLRRSLPRLQKLETSVEPAAIEAAEKLPTVLPRVTDKDQIARLAPQVPRFIRAVEGYGLDDEGMAALARLKGLEGLVLRPGRQEKHDRLGPFGGLQGAIAPITDQGFAQLQQIPTLRSLRLDRLRRVTPAGLASLAQLPLLAELSFDTMAIDDATLVKLASLPLRSLRFSNCRDFGRLGVDAITQLLDLRELAFVGCVHLEQEWLERLAALPKLERVDLSYIGSRTYFSGLSEFGDHVEPVSGVTGRVLAALGKLQNLRELSLAYGAVDAAGLSALQGAPSLQSLDLFGTEVRAADLAQLPATLTRLVLGNCREIGQDFGPVLAEATPRLHTLVLAQSDRLQDEGLKSLQAVRSLRALDLSHCPRLTAAAVVPLTALTWLEELKLHDGAAFGPLEWAAIRAIPSLRVIETEKVREVLR